MTWLIIFASIIAVLGLFVLWRVLKAASPAPIDESEGIEHDGYPMPVNRKGGLKGVLEGKRERKRSASEIGKGLKRIIKEKREVIILTLLLPTVLSLSSCLATKKPDPVIIKIPCNLAELKPIPETHDVEMIIDESCSHFVCMTEEEAGIHKTIDLNKALDSLKGTVRTEVENYQKKVLNNRFVYMTKYPELVTKAQKMFDPADYQKEKNKKPLVIDSNTKENPVVQ